MMPFLLHKFCFYSLDYFLFFRLVGCMLGFVFLFFVEKYLSWKSSLGNSDGHTPRLCKLHMLQTHWHNSLIYYFLKLFPKPQSMVAEASVIWQDPSCFWHACGITRLLGNPSHEIVCTPFRAKLALLLPLTRDQQKKNSTSNHCSPRHLNFFCSWPFPSFVVYYSHHYSVGPAELGICCFNFLKSC